MVIKLAFSVDFCLFRSKKWILNFFTKKRFLIQKGGNFLVKKVNFQLLTKKPIFDIWGLGDQFLISMGKGLGVKACRYLVHSSGKILKLRKTACFFCCKIIFLGVFIFLKKCKTNILFFSSSIRSQVELAERKFAKICIFGRNFNYFWHLRRWFLTIFGVKRVIFGTFSKLFWRCSGYVRALFLDLKCPVFAFFSAQKVGIWPPKSTLWVKIWPSERVSFDHFLGQKRHFWDFFKVALELFRVC